MKIWSAVLLLWSAVALAAQAPPVLDLAADTGRRITVHRVPGQYEGHPTTVLLADGKTILCVHPQGHGEGAIVLQRSADGGLTWSPPLPVPASFATSKETPTIHRLRDPRSGKQRLVLFSGLFPIRRSLSEDDGGTWSELEPIGDFGGIVAMASVTPLHDGAAAAFFHDDGRFIRAGGMPTGTFTLYQTVSRDGGVTWSEPLSIWSGKDMQLCEPGVVRSPDGKRLAMLLRENSRQQPSQVLFSDDEAATWGKPQPLPPGLTGDRHVAVYAADGRLVVACRDMGKDSPTRGDFVAWIGTFDDLVAGKDGQYRVRLLRNYRGTDCGYPGVEVLADGTVVATTYGHFEPGEAPFVACVRFTLAELDLLAKSAKPLPPREPGTVRPTARLGDWWTKRLADDLAAAKQGGHRLVFLGDSITQAWNDAGKEFWAERFAPLHALNLGVSGDKTQNVLWRLDHDLLAALAAANNDVRGVVLMIGTNNSGGDECSAEEIAQGIAAVVARLRAALPRAEVLLLSIFPRGEKPDSQREKCAQASARAVELTKGDHVRALDIGGVFVGAGGAIDKAIMPDFLHLSPAGYKLWADAVRAPIVDLLGK